MSKKYMPVGMNMTPSKNELGEFIRFHRVRRGWNQTKLADILGVSQVVASQIEIGTRKKRLTDSQVSSLALAFDCDEQGIKELMPEQPSPRAANKLGEKIRARREILGLSVAEAAGKMKMKESRVRGIESSKKPALLLHEVKPIATFIGLKDVEACRLLKYVSTVYKPTSDPLGAYIRWCKFDKSIKPMEMARLLGVTRQRVNQLELGVQGLSPACSDDMVKKLAEVGGQSERYIRRLIILSHRKRQRKD